MNGKQYVIDNTVDLTCNSLDIASNTHSLTDASVTFGTPVTCQYDLSCGTLTASSIYGGASTQIISAINSAVSTKQDVIEGFASVSVTKLVVKNSTAYYVRLSRVSGAICGQIFATGSSPGYSAAKVYSFARTWNGNPILVLQCDSGPHFGRDFDLVCIAKSEVSTDLGVYNNNGHDGSLTLTFMIGGSPNPIQITTL